jgi:N-acetylmuramoyl-L-alanine amidase
MRFKVKKTLLVFKQNVLMRFIAILLTPILAVLPLTKQSNANFNATLTVPASGDKGTTYVDKDATEYHIKKVVIDAGHGGKDSGCESSVGMEKKNTLAIALKLGEKIKDAYPNIEIIYTRDKDEFIELFRRAEIANKAKADLFISIHCNSSDQGQPMGTETYVLGAHKMEENFNVAKRENASILMENDYQQQYDGFDPNTNEAYIIFSLYQNAYLDKSILFGKFVQESLKENAGRRSFGVKQAGFVVLRQTAMPSVLIETGFLNNMTEGAFISSEGGQETISESIFLAFSKYKSAVETKEVKTAKANFVANTEGVIYKIQLATSSKDVSQTSKWKTLEDIEVIKEGTIYKYFKIGLETYNDAAAALKKMRAAGFPDAFIVAYKNGKRVNLDEYK